MEIERKWLLDKLPDDLPVIKYGLVEQSYISINPEVRLRKTQFNDETKYYLTLKGDGSLIREEVEIELLTQQYEILKSFIKKSPIKKEQWIFNLNGYKFEVSNVDNRFLYGEIEFETIEQAEAFQMPLDKAVEITNNSSYKMKNYWNKNK